MWIFVSCSPHTNSNSKCMWWLHTLFNLIIETILQYIYRYQNITGTHGVLSFYLWLILEAGSRGGTAWISASLTWNAVFVHFPNEGLHIPLPHSSEIKCKAGATVYLLFAGKVKCSFEATRSTALKNRCEPLPGCPFPPAHFAKPFSWVSLWTHSDTSTIAQHIRAAAKPGEEWSPNAESSVTDIPSAEHSSHSHTNEGNLRSTFCKGVFLLAGSCFCGDSWRRYWAGVPEEPWDWMFLSMFAFQLLLNWDSLAGQISI